MGRSLFIPSHFQLLQLRIPPHHFRRRGGMVTAFILPSSALPAGAVSVSLPAPVRAAVDPVGALFVSLSVPVRASVDPAGAVFVFPPVRAPVSAVPAAVLPARLPAVVA